MHYRYRAAVLSSPPGAKQIAVWLAGFVKGESGELVAGELPLEAEDTEPITRQLTDWIEREGPMM